MQSTQQRDSSFRWPDYLVFALVLLLSCVVGVYHGIQGSRKKRNNLEEFILAGRSMSVLPVTLSMFVSWLSAISFLGDPVEVYYHGAIYWVISIGYCLALPPVAQYYAPRFHRMKLYSAYEYIEKRYNGTLRVTGSVIQGLWGGLYCGFVLYGPAVSLSQVTGISVWISTVGVGFVCIFYTTLGGMKAVLWTDTVQAFIMLVGFLAVLIRGCIVVGGLGTVWNVAVARGRINVFNFNPSPFVRSTVWTYIIGGFFRVLDPFISSQAFIQRFSSLKDERSSKIAVYTVIPLYASFVTMFTLMGLVMVAYFDGCDPLSAGRIEHRDQMLPLIVVELLGFIPGFPGLFLASLFCACLSSLSSYLNSLSITLLKDIVEPLYERTAHKPLSAALGLRLSKCFCVILGIIFIGLALLFLHIKDTSIFQASLAVCGCFSGPMAALFCLGLSLPFVKTKSALVGCVGSVGILVWLFVGSTLSDLGPPSILDVNTDNCTLSNISSAYSTPNRSSVHAVLDHTQSPSMSPFGTTPEPTGSRGFSVVTLYKLSPLMFSPVGFILTCLIAIIGSAIEGLLRKRKSKNDGTIAQIRMNWRNIKSYQIAENRHFDQVSLSKKNCETLSEVEREMEPKCDQLIENSSAHLLIVGKSHEDSVTKEEKIANESML